jgi:hypothetical protein
VAARDAYGKKLPTAARETRLFERRRAFLHRKSHSFTEMAQLGALLPGRILLLIFEPPARRPRHFRCHFVAAETFGLELALYRGKWIEVFKGHDNSSQYDRHRRSLAPEERHGAFDVIDLIAGDAPRTGRSRRPDRLQGRLGDLANDTKLHGIYLLEPVRLRPSIKPIDAWTKRRDLPGVPTQLPNVY